MKLSTVCDICGKTPINKKGLCETHAAFKIGLIPKKVGKKVLHKGVEVGSCQSMPIHTSHLEAFLASMGERC